jgi:hypothetical protein
MDGKRPLSFLSPSAPRRLSIPLSPSTLPHKQNTANSPEPVHGPVLVRPFRQVAVDGLVAHRVGEAQHAVRGARQVGQGPGAAADLGEETGSVLCFLCGRGCVGGGVREKKRRGEWVVEGSRQRRPGGPSSSERAEGAARSPLAAHWVGPSPSNQCRARPRLAGGIPGLRLGAEGGECGALVSGKGPGGGRRARGLSRVRALPDSLSRAARARKKSECEQKHAFHLAGPGGHVSSHPRPMGSPPRPQASAGAAVAEGGHRRRQPPAPAP